MRNHFLKALCDLFKIDTKNPIMLQTIKQITAHIKDEQFANFIADCSKISEFRRPLEIIKKTADDYLDNIKTELFKNVENEAAEFDRKLAFIFFLLDEKFNRFSRHFDENIANEYKTPHEYLKNGAKIDESYFNDKEVYLLKQNGFLGYYLAHNDAYSDSKKKIETQMKNIIVKKYLKVENKPIEHKPESSRKIDFSIGYKKI